MEWAESAVVRVVRGWSIAVSSGFNSVVVLGRLICAPERIPTKSGSLMLKATLEVSTYRRVADGSGEEQTTNLPATLFGELATTFEQYVEVGHLVQLAGRLDGYERPGKSGGSSWLTLSFVAEQLILLPNGKRTDSPNRFAAATPRPVQAKQRPWKSQPGDPNAPLNNLGEPTELSF